MKFKGNIFPSNRKVGRKRKVEWEIQLPHYLSKSSELLDANKKVKPASAPVFNDLSAILGMTNKAIQNAVKKHSKEIFGDGVVCVQEAKRVSQSASLNDLSCELECMTVDDALGSIISINVDDKYADGLKIVGTKLNTGRVYRTLNSGWTDILNTIIVDAG